MGKRKRQKSAIDDATQMKGRLSPVQDPVLASPTTFFKLLFVNIAQSGTILIPTAFKVQRSHLSRAGLTFELSLTRSRSSLIMTLVVVYLVQLVNGHQIRHLLSKDNIGESVHGQSKTNENYLRREPKAFGVNGKTTSILKMISDATMATCFSTILVYLTAVLLGAPFASKTLSTLYLALFTSILAITPAGYCLGLSGLMHLLTTLNGVRNMNAMESYLAAPLLGSLIGCWLGAIPIPLDWDRPWQNWPITCIGGSLIGEILGVVLGLILSLEIKSSRQK